MYKLINSLISCLALGFIGSLSAVPALTASLQPAIDKIDPPFTHHTFNVDLPIDDHFANLEARKKQKNNDPSEKWQGWATVEIWTGGGSRKPVNFGDLRGRNLSNTMFELMDKQCPPSKWSSGRGRCTNDDWMEFYTNAVTEKDPWKVQLRPAWIRTNWAQWDNEAIRIVLMQIAADTLRQFTTLMPDFNCYDVDSPYWVKGTYCNVPQIIKVNLPDTSPFRDQPKDTVGNDREPPKGNYWHLETWGANADQRWQFTEIGELKPCATRYMVDKVMDKYQNDIVKQFPDYKGKFTRDARVIINGDKVCSDEL